MSFSSRSPGLALRLLARLIDHDIDFGAAGDLEEQYRSMVEDKGRVRAGWACWRQVGAAWPGFLKNALIWSSEMLKNYLKIALRNLWRHKGYSFINVAGLAIGIASTIFILLWVQDEVGYDRFHADAGTIFRVEQDQKGGQGLFHVNVTPFPLGPALKAGIPDVRDAARVEGLGTVLVRQGEKAFYESAVSAVDPSFLRIFSFPLVRGQAGSCLDEPRSIVISEDAAHKYFGAENPVGRTLIVNNAFPLTVTGVMKNMPANSSLQRDMLVPLDFTKDLGLYSESWGYNEVQTFVRLHDRRSAPAAAAKINKLAFDRKVSGTAARPGSPRPRIEEFQPFSLMPLTDMRLKAVFGFGQATGTIRSVNTFSFIALLVLLIACVNFMNLATARSANRAREVGLRKVVGAFRKSIVGQFYGESLLTAALAAVAALGCAALLLPAFNALSGKQIALAALVSWKFGLGLAGILILTALVSGSYPAIYLSAFQPIRVLQGRPSGSSKSLAFRKTLVLIQFSLSIFLLIGTGVVYRQIEFMRTKNPGYDKDHIVYLAMRGEAVKSYAALKAELLRDPRIHGVSAIDQKPTNVGHNSWGASWEGKDPDQRVLLSHAFVDFDFPETMGIEMAAGRTFSTAFAADKEHAYLVNEEVAKLMGLEPAAAVGRPFRFGGEGIIVGVMKNYHYQRVQASIQPIALMIKPRAVQFAVIRLSGGEIPAAIESVRSAWRNVNPLFPFEVRFFDEDFGFQFRRDEQTGKIVRLFSVMAVLIACLGLFGLASYTAEQRTREIGIRKVLGASAPGLAALLGGEFIKWVLAANIIAWPAAYFLMKNWLQGYAYRTNISVDLFILAGGGALLVALLTVGFQSLRAALTNPVEAIRHE